jgi:hypothetical protein
VQKTRTKIQQKMELLYHEMLLLISYLTENYYYSSALSAG